MHNKYLNQINKICDEQWLFYAKACSAIYLYHDPRMTSQDFRTITGRWSHANQMGSCTWLHYCWGERVLSVNLMLARFSKALTLVVIYMNSFTSQRSKHLLDNKKRVHNSNFSCKIAYFFLREWKGEASQKCSDNKTSLTLHFLSPEVGLFRTPRRAFLTLTVFFISFGLEPCGCGGKRTCNYALITCLGRTSNAHGLEYLCLWVVTNK